MATKKAAARVFISERSVLARINRKLEKEGKALRSFNNTRMSELNPLRRSFWVANEGEGLLSWSRAHERKELIPAAGLEKFARKVGALSEGEAIEPPKAVNLKARHAREIARLSKLADYIERQGRSATDLRKDVTKLEKELAAMK